jgi:hypothetical protein
VIARKRKGLVTYIIMFRGLLTVEQLFKVILKVSIKNGLVIESYNGIKHPKVPFKLRFVLCSA